MSDLLNSASLVMIPSGYAEDKVYSVVPSDGSGDLQLTRASNGTRVNSAGLVEVCPWNIVQESETFTNVLWNLYYATVTSNSQTAPNGTLTADTLNSTTNQYSGIYQSLGTLPTNVYTYSIYVKAGTNNFFGMLGQGSGSQIAIFNLSTGVVTSTSNLDSASIENVGNGWYRCQIQKTGAGVEMLIFSSNNASSIPTASGTVFIWGAQTNIGATAKPYFPTTDRLNVPRLTYQNGGGGCPSLLLEKQSTNSAFPSEDFSGYTGSGATIVTNQATSPDGTTNADLIYPAASGNFAGKYLNIAKSTTGVVSCFVKQASKRYAIIGTDNNSLYTCIFDLQTATVVYQATNYTGKIESVGNGWYRISAVYTSSSAADYPFIGVADNSSGGVVVDGTNGLYIWGFQYELNSSYPTSYIPTTSSSATRVADACFKTGISSLIGQTEGVMFVDTYVGNETDEVYGWLQASLSGNPNDSIQINRAGSSIQAQIYNGASVDGIITGGTVAKGQRIKVAVGYANNDLVLYLNGTQIGVDTSTAIPTCSVFQLGAYPPLPNDYTNDGGINQAVLFQTRLTNAELASITSL
jgi:hypothetical protein